MEVILMVHTTDYIVDFSQSNTNMNC